MESFRFSAKDVHKKAGQHAPLESRSRLELIRGVLNLVTGFFHVFAEAFHGVTSDQRYNDSEGD